MRKIAFGAALLAAVSMFGTVPVNAANTTSGRTDLSLYVANDPVYTVTVPETVALSATENTQVPITASDVKYIPEGKKISVTLDRGNGTFGRLYLEGTNEETGKEYMMTLYVKGTDGEFKMGALENQIKGMELASFTEDGTANFQMYPCAFDYPGSTNQNLSIQKGVEYKGSMTFGVELKDI